MKLLIITLLLLLAAIYIGNVALDDPGFIIIGYHGQVLRTSFVFFALCIILAGILLYYTVRFLSNLWAAPRKVSGWSADRKEKKAQQSLSRGFAALAEGNWETAERSLSHDASISPRLAYIHYLGAAQAAQSQGRIEQRDDYLQQAHSSAPQADLAVGITRAELQIQEGQSELARLTLEELQASHHNHPRILKLLADIYVKNEEWDALQGILKRLKRSKAITTEDAVLLEKQTWTGLLETALASGADLRETWNRIPKKLKDDPEILYLYLKQLVYSPDSAEAVPLLEKALNKQWDDRLVTLYGVAKGANPAKQLNQAEKWLPGHQEDHTLLATLGKLCKNNELWGKAKHYLEAAIEYGAGHEVYRLLAETLEQMGETQAASECCKKGLYLATDQSREITTVK